MCVICNSGFWGDMALRGKGDTKKRLASPFSCIHVVKLSYFTGGDNSC